MLDDARSSAFRVPHSPLRTSWVSTKFAPAPNRGRFVNVSQSMIQWAVAPLSRGRPRMRSRHPRGPELVGAPIVVFCLSPRLAGQELNECFAWKLEALYEQTSTSNPLLNLRPGHGWHRHSVGSRDRHHHYVERLHQFILLRPACHL